MTGDYMSITTKRKGGASVLVIFMIITLVTLGVFTITTTLVGLRFANNVSESNVIFYAVDAEAERLFAAIDTAVFEALDAPHFFDAAYENPRRLEETESYNTIITLPFRADTEYGGVSALTVEASVPGEKGNLKLGFTVQPDGQVAVNEWRLVTTPFVYTGTPQFGTMDIIEIR